MKKISGLFTPEFSMNLDDAEIGDIAAETEESKTERESSKKKLETLTQTLKLLRRLNKHKA